MMNKVIRSHFKKLSGRTSARRASLRWMAYERLERRELFARVEWIKATGGFWGVPSNWSPHEPREGDDVVIGTQQVTVNDPVSARIKSITSDGAFIVQGAGTSLNVSGDVTLTGAKALKIQNSARLTVTGSITQMTLGASILVDQSSSLIAGNLDTANTVDVTRLSSLSASSFFALGKVTVANSDLTVNGPLQANSDLVLNSNSRLLNAVTNSTTKIVVKTTGDTSDFANSAALSNVIVNGLIDMSVDAARLSIDQKLTLNNTLTLGSRAKIAFRGSQAELAGTGTVFFANTGGNGIATLTPDMTFTVGPDITIRGGNGGVNASYVGGVGTNTTLILQGRLITESGKTIVLGNTDAGTTPVRVRVSNQRAAEVQNGTLQISGIFDSAGVAKFTTAGAGAISLIGTLDNTANLTLDFPTTWSLRNGIVKGGTIKQTSTTGIRFTADGGILENVSLQGNTTMTLDAKVQVMGSLTNNGTINMLSGTAINFVGSRAELVGNGIIVLADGTAQPIRLRALDAGMTLFIGRDITIRGGSTTAETSITSSSSTSTIELAGQVVADVAGRSIVLANAGKLKNTGSIEAIGGTIVLSGSYTNADLRSAGIVKNVGGIIRLTGDLDNRGQILTFDNITGSWNLVGGTIHGGTVVQGAQGIVFTNQGGLLDNVTVQGDIDLSADNLRVNARNNLSLNGKVSIGAASYLRFVGSQTFDGDALVEFLYSTNSHLYLDGPDTALTIGPKVVIRAGNVVHAGAGAQGGIEDIQPGTTSVPAIIMNGTLLSDRPNAGISVNLQRGNLTYSGAAIAQVGEIRFVQGMNALSWPASATLSSSSRGTIAIGPDFKFLATTAEKVKLLGTMKFVGSAKPASPQLFDAASQDFGLNVAGFVESNFLMGTMRVEGNTALRLVDAVSNVDNDTSKKDAVYVNTLIVDAGASLDLAGINLYARFISIKGSVIDSTNPSNRVQTVKGGGTLLFDIPTPGTIDASDKQHSWTFAGRAGARIDLEVNPGSTGNSPASTPLLNRVRLTLKDPSGTPVITLANTAAGSPIALTNYELKSNGIFTVVVEADPATNVGNYMITVGDVTPDRRRVNVVVTSSHSQGVDYGNSVEFIATVAPQAITVPNATGTVQFQLDGVNVGDPVGLEAGVARITLAKPTAGSRSIRALFVSDNGVFDSQQIEFVQTIRKVVLSVRAPLDYTRVAGTAVNPQAQISGFVAGEGPSSISGGEIVLTVNSATQNTAGSQAIFASGTLFASNYSFLYINGNMVVTPDIPATLNKIAGDQQSVIIERTLPIAFRTKILDRFANLVPGASVTFEAPVGSGTFADGTSKITVIASSLGEAQASALKVGTQPGVYVIKATCNGVVVDFQVTVREAGDPLEFTPVVSVNERDSKFVLTLKRNTPIASSLTVTLQVDPPGFLDAPLTVVFPSGSDEESRDVNIINDTIAHTLIDGAPAQITITASAAGLPNATMQLSFTDDDVPSLTLPTGVSVDENGTKTLTLTRNTDTTGELLVKLSSSDPLVLTLPETVIFTAGQKNVDVVVTGLGDLVAFGNRMVNVTATAVGLNPSTTPVIVKDVDAASLTIVPLGSDSIREGESATFRLLRNTPTNVALTIALSSSLTQLVELPTAVTLPLNATFVDFTVRVLNDQLVSSNLELDIKAELAGFMKASQKITLIEDDVATLILSLDRTTTTEGAADGIPARIKHNRADLQAMPVTIEISAAGQLDVPLVKFEAGNSDRSLDFVIRAIDDSLFEGSQNLTITIRVVGFEDVIANLQIEDNESLRIEQLANNPTEMSEKDGSITMLVRRQVTNIDEPLVVNLLSADTTELNVPASVIIPAGQEAAEFVLTSVDDQILDGLQTVLISASASGYASADQSVNVTDYESVQIQLSTSSVVEGDTTSVTVSRSDIDDLTQALPITFLVSDGSRLSFIDVVIPAGLKFTTVEGTTFDNSIFEENPVSVVITVHSEKYVDGSTTLLIGDNERLQLSVLGTPSLSEKDGRLTLTVKRLITNTQQPLLVSLQSSDPTELPVPADVTIPPGQDSVDVVLTAADDRLLDGLQSVQVVATAQGYSSAEQLFDVTDYESLGLSLDISRITERDGKVTVTISRPEEHDLSDELVISLSNSQSSRLILPTEARIPANATSITVEGIAHDNSVVEGNQQATITAKAGGYIQAEGSLEILEDDVSNPWQNRRNNLDVNDNGTISPLDALLVINWLNNKPSALPSQKNADEYVDTNGDNSATPIDALLVINYINTHPTTAGEGEASEGEASVDKAFESYDLDNFRVEIRNKRSSASQSSSSRVEQIESNGQ